MTSLQAYNPSGGYRSRVVGTGSYLPEKVVTNTDLTRYVETSDEWIRQRTGIERRHVADDEETTSRMALESGRRALQAAGLSAADIDTVIVATSTPDCTFPATAMRVQAGLEMQHGYAFDLQAVCSGFIYGLSVADSLLKTGQARRILLIGAERFTNLIDWTDRSTCVLFGDGAGAVVLEQQEDPRDSQGRPCGFLSHHLHSEGQLESILKCTGGPGTTRTTGTVVMEGREVFKRAVAHLAEVVDETLNHHGITGADLDWLVPHQANLRIIEATAQKLNMPMDKVILTIQHHGNTSAASVPLALDQGVRDGRVKTGDLVLMEAMGAGLTWGASLLRF